MIWGFGAAFDQPIHRYLDNIFREFFSKLQIPNKDTVFQYFYHEKDHKFYHWKELVGDFEKRIEYPYDQLFVPTIDSVSYTKILQYLIDLDKKTFFTGATGVGKSIIA
jgi:dynein heavy chain